MVILDLRKANIVEVAFSTCLIFLNVSYILDSDEVPIHLRNNSTKKW